MKSYIPIIFIILLFSCKSSDNDTIILLDETIERSNSYLEAESYNFIAGIANKYYVYTTKLETVKHTADTLEQKHKSIQSIYNKIRRKYNVIYEEEDRSFIFKNTTYKINELNESIKNYLNFVLRLNNDTTIQILTDNLLKQEKLKRKIRYTDLNLLINKINYIHTLVLYSLNESTKLKKYRTTKFIAVVIPERNILKLGEKYEAEIFLSILDTTAEYEVIINNETYKPQNGIINYKKHANKVGTITDTGILIINKPGSFMELDTFSFKIEYKVINK